MKRLHDNQPEISIPDCCSLFGYSKQAYYKREKQLQSELLCEEIILKMVNSLRQDQPVLGGRKLYHILKTKIHPDLDIGRDKFFDLLRDNGLLIRHSRVYRPVTTLSWNRFHKYPNLIKDYDPLSANQLYVADITYVRNVEGRFYYLSLLTDAYSRKIVGWALEDSLEMSGPIKALNMALETLPPGSDLIHHSDRGIQYCSTAYIKELEKHHILISMTENGDPLENAIAERINGILKNEWNDMAHLQSWDKSMKYVEKVIGLYNNERPHQSLNYLTPEIVHRTGIVTQRKWKNYYPPKDAVTMASDLSFEPQCQAIPVQMQENVKQM